MAKYKFGTESVNLYCRTQILLFDLLPWSCKDVSTAMNECLSSNFVLIFCIGLFEEDLTFELAWYIVA